MKKVIFKDGSFKTVKDEDVWIHCNNPEFDKVEDLRGDNMKYIAVPLRKRELITFNVGEETVKITLHTKHNFNVVTAVLYCPDAVKLGREPNPIYLSRQDSLKLPDDNPQ